MKYYLYLVLLPAVFNACKNKSEKKDVIVDTSEIHAIRDSTQKTIDSALVPILSNTEGENILVKSKTIVELLRDKNFAEISKFISPASGLRFSSNSYLDTTDIRFSKTEVAGLWNDLRKYKFPDYSGEGVKITFREYYKSDIYDRDFAKAENVELNKLKRGPNSDLFNLKEIYPQASYVDFHIPAPKNPDLELDWATLRLIFIKEGNEWYLRHIVHDNWTP